MTKFFLVVAFLFSFNLFAEVSVNIDGKVYYCSEEEEHQREWSCIPWCGMRNINGDCYSYGKDFCGYNPKCAKNCVVRYSSGDCSRYGKDSCQ